MFSNHQNSVQSSPKSSKWHFRDSKFTNFIRPPFQPPKYGTADVTSYAMKDWEFFPSFGNFCSTPSPQLYMLATVLG